MVYAAAGFNSNISHSRYVPPPRSVEPTAESSLRYGDERGNYGGKSLDRGARKYARSEDHSPTVERLSASEAIGRFVDVRG